MALDSYVGLITAVQDFSGRADASTARVDYFIDLTENWLNNNLRVHEMETANGNLTASSGVISNPADFLQWKNLGVTSNGVRHQLKPIALEQKSFFDDGTTGIPTHYYIRGSSTVLAPTPDSGSYTYDGTYYQKIPALGPSQTANWVLTNYSDAYLFGCLVMAGTYFTDLESRTPAWQALFSQAAEGIKQASMNRGFGQVMQLRLEGPVY